MLIEIIALVVLLIATFTDFRTREVPDTLSYIFIGAAAVVRLYYSITQQSWHPLLEGMLGFGAFFGFGWLLYKFNMWGGADTKILGGMGAMFGLWIGNSFMLDFMINLLFAGAGYGIIFSIFIAFNKKVKFQRIRHAKEIALASLILLIPGFFFNDFFLKTMYLVLVLVSFASVYLVNFLTAVQNSMKRYVSPLKLTEGDWVVNDIRVQGRLICRKKDNGLSLKQIAQLNKLHRQGKINRVLIKEGIPFIPSFLIAYLVTWTLGNIILLFL